MPEPLKRKMRDGRLYVRPREIEEWLVELEAVQPAERIRSFAVSSRKSPGCVPPEALVHFLRRAWAEGQQRDFEAMFRLLMKRVEQSIGAVVSESTMAGARGIREEIMQRFAERIAKDCMGRVGLMDFYEVRFDKAIVAFRRSALRQIGPTSDNTVPLSVTEEDDLEVSAEVEAAAAAFLGGNSSKLDDEAFRFALAAAIDRLPKDQKQVIGLWLQGIQIDAKDKNTMTISRILKCDERTIRNRRDRAFKSLKASLQEVFVS